MIKIHSHELILCLQEMMMTYHATILFLVLVLTEANSLSPIFENASRVCDEVECGRGRCEAAVGYPFNFRCICEPNWKRTRLDTEDNLDYLPCVIPNCSLDYSCMAAPPPLPPNPFNASVFDPCYWIYCGEGMCMKNSTYGHTCQCNNGGSNLLGIPIFPCYNQCALGSDCTRLGIRVSNSTTSPGNDSSSGSSIISEKMQWMMSILLVFTVTHFM